MKTAAVILARAGSRGLPGKNVRDVAGRPCVAWTIEHAQRARSIDRVVVSSDDDRALEVGRSMGAQTIERPPGLAGASATVDAAARHAVTELDDGAIDAVAILYANVPVRPADLTDRVVGVVRGGGLDSAQSYAPVGKHHPWWMVVVDEATGGVRPWEGEVMNHGVFRRQDLPPAHVPDGGALVVTRAALFLEVAGAGEGPHAFLGARRGGVVTGAGEVVDIDDEADARVAEAILGARAGAGA
jgi:CMP-N,N'-diacetyllegionaminic acid synthase